MMGSRYDKYGTNPSGGKLPIMPGVGRNGVDLYAQTAATGASALDDAYWTCMPHAICMVPRYHLPQNTHMCGYGNKPWCSNAS